MLRTIFEVIMVVAVIIAVFHEPAIADWEQRIFSKIKSFVIKNIKHKHI